MGWCALGPPPSAVQVIPLQYVGPSSCRLFFCMLLWESS